MSIEIGSMIDASPDFKNGRPCIASTGITVHRIAIWYKLGHSPEEIARRYGHLSVAQVFAALTYYHANRDEIEAAIAADEIEADRIESEYLQERKTA